MINELNFPLRCFAKVVLINSNFTLFIHEMQCGIPFYVEYSDLSVLFTLLGKQGVTCFTFCKL